MIILIALMPFSVSAQEIFPNVTHQSPLTAEQLDNVFNGQSHRGSYNFMRKSFTTYSFEETTFEDGTLEHIQADVVDKGVWAISETLICYRYANKAFQSACFEIYQLGNCYYHYLKTVAGRSQGVFTARTVIKGESPDCAPLIS